MSDNNNSTLSAAMNLALPLGLFWVFRYLFAIGSDYFDLLKYAYIVLKIGTPIIFYIILIRYRDINLGGKIGYRRSISFSLLLFIFASIPESLIMSLHLLIINPDLVIEQNRMALELIAKYNWVDKITYAETKTFLTSYGAMYYTACNAIGNIIIGFFLSIFIGYFVSSNNTPSTSNDL